MLSELKTYGSPEHIDKCLKIIGEFMGYKYYPAVKVPSERYGTELHSLEKLDTHSVWVLNPTDRFESHLCVSSLYYDIEVDEEEPYDGWVYSLKYDTSWDMLIPAMKKFESWYNTQPRTCKYFELLKSNFTAYRLKEICIELAGCIEFYNQYSQYKF